VILYPAIDILGSSAVRLVQGDFDQATRYQADPLDAARSWVAAGAERLHVVDLDGARAGHPVNLEHVRRIATETGLPLQLGGGLRSIEALEDAVAAGASRVVLGTAAFTDLLEDALAAHGERLVVSIDVRSHRVSTAGWTQTGQLRASEAIGALQERGVRNFVYTDVDRDGMLGGLDNADIAAVADVVGAAGGELLYSGGIGELADLEGLSRLRHPALIGVIVGKALYERRFTVAEALDALAA